MSNQSPEKQLEAIQVDLRAADDQEEQEEIGRTQLASLLLHHSTILDKVIKAAKRDNRMRRCLSAARYYTGQSEQTCAKIDAFLKAPFPMADRRGRR